MGLVDADTWEVLYPGAVDADGDGFPVEAGDCDDHEARATPCYRPDAPENGIDEDCRGGDAIDADDDGWAAESDCDDGDPGINWGMNEIPYDGIDQDCDGEDQDDLDRDGHPVPEDCDDADFLVYPAAWDFLCDGVDQDCDGEDRCDEGEPAASTPGGCGRGGAAGLLLVPLVRLRRRGPRQAPARAAGPTPAT